VRWRRWSATVLGFLGVLVMVRPGAATFDPAALVALGDSLSIAFLVVLVKRLPASETALIMLFHFGIVSSLAALPLAVLVWRAPTPTEYGLLIAIGVLGVLAQTCWIRAFRAGEASAVAPFDYTRLIFAAAFGFALFAETLDGWTVAGAAVIVGSTVYIARREAQLAKAR
jgi:drug/metabolite transporter (DMT)-like permease